MLTATATASDVNGDPVTLTYEWKVGTTVLQTTSTSSLTNTLNLVGKDVNGGDQVTVVVTPSDGANGPTATDSVTLANGAPSATVSLGGIDNQPLNDGEQLTATVSGASDPDGDPISFTYVWKAKNLSTDVETTIRTITTSDTTDAYTKSNADLPPGPEYLITVEVTPSDGLLHGTPTSASRTVLSA